MKIVLSRVDERLVHGQIIASWTKQLAVRKILIIDDQSANDPFMAQVLTMAAPSGIDIQIMTVNKATEALKGNDELGDRTMLLFKHPKSALGMVSQGAKLPELNIGNMGAGPNRKSISKNVYMSAQEIEQVKTLNENKVHVYLQMLVTDPKIDIMEKIK